MFYKGDPHPLDIGKAPFVCEMRWAGRYFTFQVGMLARSAMRLQVGLKGSRQTGHMTSGKVKK